MTSRIYTASVVGGGFGGQLSMTALAASPHFKLTAVADLREDVRRQLDHSFPGIRTFTDHETMFRECPTDVVAVSTFPPTHEEISKAALALPSLRGILVEKPLGHTYASGQRILAAIQERGLPVAVPHGLMARRTPLEIIERVRRGDIGTLKLVEVQCRGWDIINAGIHWLNFFVNLTGLEPVESVLTACDATARTYRDGMQVETIAVMTAQTASGVRIVMHMGDDVKVNAEPRLTVFRLIGTQGLIEFYGWDTDYRIINAEHPAGVVITPEELPVSGHRYHLEHLAEQMDAGTADRTLATSSLMALELCEAAYLSSRHRCQVTLPLEDFKVSAPTYWDPGRPYSGADGGRDGRKL